MKFVIHQTSVNLERTVLFLETEWAAIPLSFSKNYFSIEILHVDWKATFFVAFLEYAAFTHFLCTLLPRLYNVDISSLYRENTVNPIRSVWTFFIIVSWLGHELAWLWQRIWPWLLGFPCGKESLNEWWQ